MQATNDDATLCKLSAVRAGYWTDPHLPALVRQAGHRRDPEIHLGYYARVAGVRALVGKFCEAADTAVQVLSLGAGFDTTYWRMLGEGRALHSYIEVDFPGVTARKAGLVRRNPSLLAGVAGEEGELRLGGSTDLHGPRYHLVAADFTDLAALQCKLADSRVSYSCPTLVLAECALVYVDTVKTSMLLAWLAKTFSSATFVNYEQLNMEDRFGRVMQENLLARGCLLAGVAACRDKAAQLERFTAAGWDSAQCWDMNEVYSLLPRQEVERAERLERLDEKELLTQLFHHYCITVARRNSNTFNFDSVNFD